MEGSFEFQVTHLHPALFIVLMISDEEYLHHIVKRPVAVVVYQTTNNVGGKE